MTEEEMIEQARRHGFPNLRVACKRHGERKVEGVVVECRAKECQGEIERRKAAIRA